MAYACIVVSSTSSRHICLRKHQPLLVASSRQDLSDIRTGLSAAWRAVRSSKPDREPSWPKCLGRRCMSARQCRVSSAFDPIVCGCAMPYTRIFGSSRCNDDTLTEHSCGACSITSRFKGGNKAFRPTLVILQSTASIATHVC